MELLPGETLLEWTSFRFSSPISLSYTTSSGRYDIFGELKLSNFQIFFQEKKLNGLVIKVPFLCIWKMRSKMVDDLKTLVLVCKDFRILEFRFKNQVEFDNVHEYLRNMEGKGLEDFWFRHLDEPPTVTQDGDKYNLVNLLLRNDFSEDCVEWSVIENRFAKGYPKLLVVPIYYLEDDIAQMSLFRYDQKIPVCTWGNWNPEAPYYGLTISRCSRPNISLDEREATTNREPNDVMLVEALHRAANENYWRCHNNYGIRDKKLYLFDTGHHEENLISFYGPYFSYQFGGLKITELELLYSNLYSASCDSPLNIQNYQTSCAAWADKILKYFQYTWALIQKMDSGLSVLVQSGGKENDVSEIIISLLQIIIDPYFRTVEGFCHLIEKEWIHFGAKLRSSSKTEKIGKFFFFINCVWTLLQLHSMEFEFTESLLRDVLDNQYADKYNTLHHNHIWSKDVWSNYSDLWISFLYDKEKYVNQFYSPNPIKRSLPNREAKHLPVWDGYFLRFQMEVMEQNSLLRRQIQDNGKRNQIFISAIDIFYLDKRFRSVADALEEIHVSYTHITTLPDDFSTLKALTSLNIEYTKLETLSTTIIAGLPRLKVLSLKSNRLTVLPENLDILTELETLRIDDNDLYEFPVSLGYCISLLNLSASGNNLNRLPTSFPHLTKLRRLNLSNNRFVIFSFFFLKKLLDLERLDLSSNKLEKIPESIWYPRRLSYMNFSDNQIRIVPYSIGQCTYLENLFLYDNNLETLPLSIGGCVNLRTLNVNGNNLTSIPFSIRYCRKLVELSAAGNAITKLPISISECLSLSQIHLGNNQIENLVFSIGSIKNLNTLDLSNNRISELPLTISLLDKLVDLDLSGNPVHNLNPEMFKSLPFLKSTLREKLDSTTELNRIKVILVGKENVGKTTLVNSITHRWSLDSPKSTKNNLPGLSTDGIDISSFSISQSQTEDKKSKRKMKKKVRGFMSKSRKKKDAEEEFILHIWDFAGQEIYYTTHQLFLSEDSYYLIVFALNDRESIGMVEFWIKSVLAHSKRPIILIVGTHKEESTLTEHKYAVDQLKKFKEMYVHTTSVFKYFEVSNTTQEGVPELREYLGTEIVASYVKAEIPYAYLLVEQLLVNVCEELQDQNIPPIISKSQVIQFCAQMNITESEKCLSWLKSVGSIVFFGDDDQLKNMVILDPNWMIDVMASMFSTKHNWNKNGVLFHSDLHQIWKEYSIEVQSSLLILLGKFGLFYKIPYGLENMVSDLGLLREINRSEQTQQSRPLSYNHEIGIHPDLNPKEFFDESGISLVPALFINQRPTDIIEKHWSYFPTDSGYNNQIDRIYLCPFVPFGLVSRLIVRIMENHTPITFWKDGVLSNFRGDIILVELYRPYEDDDFYLYITARSNDLESCRETFYEILDITETLFKDWPNLQFTRYVSCLPDYIQKKPNARLISINKIESDVLRGETHVFLDGDSIPISDIAPDICLASYTGRIIDFVSTVSQYEEIGVGAFAEVYRGKWENRPVAIKKLVTEEENSSGIYRDFRQEVMIFQQLTGEKTIVNLLGISFSPLCIIMELCAEGNLFSLLHSKTRMNWKLRIKIASEIAAGLNFMHTRTPPIIHRDVKSPNIMIMSLDPNSDVCAKIADFGTSVKYEEPLVEVLVDNPIWLAPEVLQLKPYGLSVDIYAYGMILWELMTREKLYSNVEFTYLISRYIVEGVRPVFPEVTPEKYKKLSQECWDPKASQRPLSDVVLQTIDEISQETRNFEIQENNLISIEVTDIYEMERAFKEDYTKNIVSHIEENNAVLIRKPTRQPPTISNLTSSTSLRVSRSLPKPPKKEMKLNLSPVAPERVLPFIPGLTPRQSTSEDASRKIRVLPTIPPRSQ